MSRAEALAWQIGCTFGAVLGVVIVEVFADQAPKVTARVRRAWRTWQAG